MRIVIVEDNRDLAQALADRLRDQGHGVDLLTDGAGAADYLVREGADLVILDVNLPGVSGFEIVKDLRARGEGMPVLMLTARGEVRDRVAGLDAGADDYLVKPFEMEELDARLRALARRKEVETGALLSFGALTFDRATRAVTLAGMALTLPRRELAVLECLLDRQGRLVPKEALSAHVYGTGADVTESAVEPHISRLRKRLAGHGLSIKTARGLGYMLSAS
ncbi:MAG: response regulator transcription factor [Pseudomonadota bacterium]